MDFDIKDVWFGIVSTQSFVNFQLSYGSWLGSELRS